MNAKPATVAQRKAGLLRAVREFNSHPSAANWCNVKRWMLYRQAPASMNFEQARDAWRSGLDKPFDETA